MPERMIEITNLTRLYGQNKALDNISLTVEHGQVVGFLGPNGAGKTTTMRILAGLLAPSEGEVKIAGLDILDQPVEARARLGYLPETPPIYPEMTVREYLDHMAALRRVPKAGRQAAVEQAMARCGLENVQHRLLRNLSKGYRQRSGIAQAIVHSPPVVILDEPTVGLDPIQIREIRTLIRELGGEHAVLLSTHILPEVRMTCDRVAVISEGRIVAEDSVENLERQSGQGQRLRLRMTRPPATDELLAIPGVAAVKADGEHLLLTAAQDHDPLPALLSLAVEKQWDLREMTPDTQDLEEVFVRLARREVDDNEMEAA